MRHIQTLLLFAALVILASSPLAHAASCSCGSGSASYDFLADPAVNIDMPTPDEFLNSAKDEIAAPYAEFLRDDPEENSTGNSKLSIDMDPDVKANLLLSRSGDEITGSGSMVRNNVTSEISARGSLDKGLMKLDLVTISGDLYKLELEEEETHLAGKYVAFSSDGKTWTGDAEASEEDI